MILDSGIASFFHKVNIAENGAKPVFADSKFCEAYFGELSFETNPYYPTERREDIKTDARIRVLQNRNINNHDRVLLNPVQSQNPSVRGAVSETEPLYYEVTRAYHGTDDDSGELITDLNLTRLDGVDKYVYVFPVTTYVGTASTVDYCISPILSGETIIATSDASIATIDNSGKAVGVKKGTCDIFVTVDGVTGSGLCSVLESSPPLEEM